MGIAAGRLRHVVDVQREVESVDGEGFPSKGWDSIGKFFASVEPLSVREMLQSQQIQSEVRARIIMRYNAKMKPSMRVVHGDTVYGILGIQRDPDVGIEWMTLSCSSGLNDG